MSEKNTQYSCQECGWLGKKWHGKCPQCSKWNSIVEELVSTPTGKKDRPSIGTVQAEPQPFSEMKWDKLKKQASGLQEFDRVLGGGITPGSFVLLGGDPGIGKSTLLLQVCGHLAQKNKKVLYISAEESSEQSALRAGRLQIDSKSLLFFSENSLDAIIKQSQKMRPYLLVVDSIQTVYVDTLSSAPGTVAQVREAAGRLMTYAKSNNVVVCIVGHVTKDGSLAGPRVLEHLVDTVLSFEGDSNYHFRILRSIKNRFGPSNELAVFEMDEDGLKEVTNPSELFLSERSDNSIGSACFVSMEGSRPLVCEIQALTVSSFLNVPRRTALGLDLNRVHMVAAVLDKYLGTELGRRDLFLNLTGGLKINEPASDLGVAMAILSSRYKKALPKQICFFGEIGLTGELRSCRFIKERLKEAQRLGFKEVCLSESSRSSCQSTNFKLKLNFKSRIEELAGMFKNER